MNKHHYDKTERRQASKRDLLDALRSVLLAPRTKARSENREPTREELNAKYRLDKADE